MLKVLSYWNLNSSVKLSEIYYNLLKVLSYWNLNSPTQARVGEFTIP